MPDKYSHKEKPTTNAVDDGTNWTIHGPDMPTPTNIFITVDDHGIKIEKGGVIFLEMSYGEIAAITDKIDSMEAEIGRLWAALQGKLEVELD